MISRMFTRTNGLNTQIPAHRSMLDPQSGTMELAIAVNVDVDNSGQIGRRPGQPRISSLAWTTIWCNGGRCFGAYDRTNDSAVAELLSDGVTVHTLATGFTKGARYSFTNVGDKYFFANNYENGLISGDTVSSWPDTTGQKGTRRARQLYPAPIAKHIAYWAGIMWLAFDNIIVASEPYSPGAYDLANRYFHFGSDIRMIRPVPGGLWLSDSEQFGFITCEESFQNMRWIPKHSNPAHEYSVANELVNLSGSAWQVPGKSAVWSCDDGFVVGHEDGQFDIVTNNTLEYPKGTMGATVIQQGAQLINTVW